MSAEQNDAYDQAVELLLDNGRTPKELYGSDELMRAALERVMHKRGQDDEWKKLVKQPLGASVTVPRRMPTLL